MAYKLFQNFQKHCQLFTRELIQKVAVLAILALIHWEKIWLLLQYVYSAILSQPCFMVKVTIL